MSRIRDHRIFSSDGYTLVELLIGVLLSTILFVGIFDTYLFIGRNLTRVANSSQQDVKARTALRQFAKDVGAAISFTSMTSANLAFTMSVPLTNCSTTAGSATVTCASTAGMTATRAVMGAGIPTTATVSSVTNATTFVMSANATATATGLTLYTGHNITYLYNSSALPTPSLTRTDSNTGVTTTLLTDINTSATNGFSYYNTVGGTASSTAGIKEIGFSFSTKVGVAASGTEAQYAAISQRVVVHNKPLLQ